MPAPRLNATVPITTIVTLPSPVPYCTNDQLSDSTFICQAANAKDFITIRTDNTCTDSVVKVGLDAQIGDFVWDDSSNKNGVQDAGEPGVA